MQNKAKWNKIAWRIPLSSFCVCYPLLGIAPTLNTAWGTQWDSTAKTDFSFGNGCQLQTDCWLGLGTCVYFTLSVLDLHLLWTCASLVSAAIVSVSLYMHDSCCVWKAPFYWNHPLPLIIFLTHGLQRCLGLDENIPFRTECSLSSCGSFCKFSSIARRSFSDVGGGRHTL